MTAPLPQYPIYVPSKGRADRGHTAQWLTNDGVPFHLVVEPQEEDAYRAAFPEASVLVLPFRDHGSVVPARNWIAEHATAQGVARHWQIDDNIRGTYRLNRGLIVPIAGGAALRICEAFTDRYTNIAVSGLNYEMFVTEDTARPYWLNHHVYSTSLIDHRLPFRWRGRYNEDTDLCLQVLTAGYCTVALNAVVAWKLPTMKVSGGNTEELYQGDGRAHMARALERQWPKVVTTKRRFGRPQHYVRWSMFRQPLIRRDDIDWSALARVDEFGLELEAVREVRSPRLRALLEG